MFDIHHHLLFDLDDGPSDIDVSVAMAEMSIENGVTHIACTPHSSERYRFDPELTRERLGRIQERVGDRITLGLGCDFHLMYENIEAAVLHPKNFSINGKGYLLVEFPNYSISHNITDTFFRLGLAGLTSIITHPERNPVIVRQPERLAEWLRAGCYVQVTAASLSGRFGKIAQRVAYELLDRNWVHFLATDAHDVQSRPPQLREAYDLVADKYGRETAERLCVENPKAAFFGEPLPPQPEPEELKRSSGLFGRIFGH
ncbi:MAG TPA: CpsB/CapC family capsule biosynthesis tyrosine phosphatase [Acidobacteriaceae bacterium]|nr:CpsB/CapC family capsule biosynthesis tyrosine phosphatase [Acidobacteriaceae bacterium]